MKSTTIRFSIIFSLFIVVLPMGCSYKIPVQQGNILKQKEVDEIKPGMSKRQVAIILGTPAIADPFNQDRWDFISTYKRKGKMGTIKRFSLYFSDDKLIKTEGNYFPEKNSSTIDENDDSVTKNDES